MVNVTTFAGLNSFSQFTVIRNKQKGAEYSRAILHALQRYDTKPLTIVSRHQC